MIIHFTFK